MAVANIATPRDSQVVCRFLTERQTDCCRLCYSWFFLSSIPPRYREYGAHLLADNITAKTFLACLEGLASDPAYSNSSEEMDNSTPKKQKREVLSRLELTWDFGRVSKSWKHAWFSVFHDSLKSNHMNRGCGGHIAWWNRRFVVSLLLLRLSVVGVLLTSGSCYCLLGLP